MPNVHNNAFENSFFCICFIIAPRRMRRNAFRLPPDAIFPAFFRKTVDGRLFCFLSRLSYEPLPYRIK